MATTSLSARLRKFVLATHLMCSVGWIGSALAYLALGATAVVRDDVQSMRAAWVGMEVIGWFATVPLALASLVTGVLIALTTKWGLFRHYWVVISFALTVVAVVVLLLHMPTVSATVEVARVADQATLESLGGDLFHPGVGLLLLLCVHVLNVYKPKGLTKYGWRRQQEEGVA